MDGTPESNISGTVPGAWWFHSITEEIRNAIVQLGTAPDWTKTDQLGAAIASALSSAISGAAQSLATPQGAAEVGFVQSGVEAVPRTMLAKARDIWNARDYDVPADGSKDATAILNTLIVRAPAFAVITLSGTFLVLGTLAMRNGISIVLEGSIIGKGQATVIDFTGVSGAAWIGGTLAGDSQTAMQTGFLLANASGNVLRGMAITGCLNKGIALSATSSLAQATQGNLIAPLSIDGATSSNGAGLSLYGDACTHNIVNGGLYSGNRIGLTINGSHMNTVVAPECSGNSEIGLTIDGIVTNAGDGGQRNKIIGGQYNGNGPNSSYGGIYAGNGSSRNIFLGVTCKDNTGAGIRTSGTVGLNDVVGNTFVAPVTENNGASGISLSAATRTKLVAPVANTNTGRGIQIFKSDYTTVEAPEVIGNTAQGILVQSGYTRVIGGIASGNDTGYQVASGGSADSTNNLILGAHLAGNSTADISIQGGLGRFVACSGNMEAVKADAGDANFTYSPGAATTVIYNTPLTAIRSVVLGTISGLVSGDSCRIVRTPNATGPNLNVGTGPLKVLTPGSWVDVRYDGSAWRVTGSGAL